MPFGEVKPKRKTIRRAPPKPTPKVVYTNQPRESSHRYRPIDQAPRMPEHLGSYDEFLEAFKETAGEHSDPVFQRFLTILNREGRNHIFQSNLILNVLRLVFDKFHVKKK